MPVLSALEKLSRQELIERALRFGVPRPELMTRVELCDEIVRRSETDPAERKRARGWLGIARDLLASVVEQGLHLPDAAALIRGDVSLELGARAPAPVATVTLSEIYAAQGHLDRAVKMLDQVLEKEPDHDPARALRDKFIAERDRRAAVKAAARAREAARTRSGAQAVVEESEAVEESERHEEREQGTAETEQEPREAQVEARAEAVAWAEVDTRGEAEARAEPDAGTAWAEKEAPVVSEPEPVAVEPEPVVVEPEPLVSELEAVAVEPAPATVPTARAGRAAGPRHDSVVLMRSAAGIRVYWELCPESRRRAEQRWPEGRPVVRIVGWRPSWDGAERVEHDVDIAEAQDSAIIEALGDVAAVRAALGWNAAGELHPFSLATELAAGATTTDLRLRWIPPAQRAMGENPTAVAARALTHWGSIDPR
jgi:hypothetical protein